MPLNLHNKAKESVDDFGPKHLGTPRAHNPVVLMVEDQEEAWAEIKEVLQINGSA